VDEKLVAHPQDNVRIAVKEENHSSSWQTLQTIFLDVVVALKQHKQEHSDVVAALRAQYEIRFATRDHHASMCSKCGQDLI